MNGPDLSWQAWLGAGLLLLLLYGLGAAVTLLERLL